MKKISLILLCLLLLFGAVSCTTPNSDKPPYEDIINEYTALLEKRIKEEALAEPKNSNNEIKTALFEIVRDTADPSIMGYATKDINDDGAEELVLLDKSSKLYALFTLQDGKPVLLLKADEMSAAIAPDGTVYAYQSFQGQGGCTQVKKISNGKLEGFEYGYSISGDTFTAYKCENGVKTDITKEEKLQLDESLQSVKMNLLYQTKTTGFRFVAAGSNASSSTAPIPNFTNYDGIISAYKTIVKVFSRYKQSDWINGEFDSLFTITDNDSYDAFHQIFWSGIRKMPTQTYFGQTYASDGDNSYGYAKKDLNGDGVEELILLNDNYEILALFTEKDGKAQLVDGAYAAWIDQNGRIRKDVETGGLGSRDKERYVYVLDGTALRAETAVGYKVNDYLQKEGWYKIEGGIKVDISAEEGEALYAAYNILPSDYCNEEYTRTFSGIEFIPLFEATLAGQKHVNTYSNSGFIGGNTLTVSEFSTNDATAIIKFVYVEGKFDPETNPNPVVHNTELAIQAIRNGSRYEFEKDGVKGYIEFAVNSAWVVVTESQNEHVFCRAYLFNYPEN